MTTAVKVRDRRTESPHDKMAWSADDGRLGSRSDDPDRPSEARSDRALAAFALQREIAERLLLEALREKENRDAAEEARAATLSFLGRVSHEIRTPLNVIAGYADLMDMEVHGAVTGQQRDDLACIREAGNQLLTMVNDLLNYLKVQSGQLTYRSLDVPVCDLLTRSLTLMTPLMNDKGLYGHVGECANDVIVRADPDRMRQIVANLLTNAIKFTASGGEIELGCDVAEDVVHIWVKDTGAGIPSDRFEDIFKPFVQGSEGRSGTRQGVGLGLAIGRDLSRAMQGDLNVESLIGVGSQFTLTLPRA